MGININALGNPVYGLPDNAVMSRISHSDLQRAGLPNHYRIGNETWPE
jgi:hypothetical protein